MGSGGAALHLDNGIAAFMDLAQHFQCRGLGVAIVALFQAYFSGVPADALQPFPGM